MPDPHGFMGMGASGMEMSPFVEYPDLDPSSLPLWLSIENALPSASAQAQAQTPQQMDDWYAMMMAVNVMPPMS